MPAHGAAGGSEVAVGLGVLVGVGVRLGQGVRVGVGVRVGRSVGLGTIVVGMTSVGVTRTAGGYISSIASRQSF